MILGNICYDQDIYLKAVKIIRCGFKDGGSMILYDRETVNGGKLMEENKNVIAETEIRRRLYPRTLSSDR